MPLALLPHKELQVSAALQGGFCWGIFSREGFA